MLIHNRMESSTANGPGNRAVVWVQGCSLNCKGCWNPETHLFDNSKNLDSFLLEDWILGLKDVDGLTWSGGEPMQQAPALWLVMDRVHKVRPEFSFGMYSGYSQKQLEEGRWRWKSALDAKWVQGTDRLWGMVKQNLDFAILGKFLQEQACDDKPLCGSRNQELVLFSQRYTLEDFGHQQILEMVVDGDLTQITGFPVGVELDDPLLAGMVGAPGQGNSAFVEACNQAARKNQDDDKGDELVEV